MSLNGVLSRWFYERAARDKSYEELVEKLHRNEAATYSRMMNASEISFNRARAAHVIGIERWSAHRLRVLLGESLVIDEYDGYAPSEQLSMAELAQEFKETRAATITLVRELQSKGVELSRTVIHNDVGELSAGGWLFYIENHTGRETLTLMPRLHNRTKHAVES